MRRKCLQCGAEFEGRSDTTLCSSCAAKSKMSNIMRERICQQCGCTFTGGPRAWYCPNCRADRRKAASRRHKRNGTKRPIGSTDICQVCGKEYVVTSARCKYCPDCAKDAVRAVDREQSKAWNHANIDYAKQRAQRHAAAAKIPCAICGKLFVPGAGGPVTCSAECNRVYRQQMSAKYHIAHRDEINARHRKNKGDLNND